MTYSRVLVADRFNRILAEIEPQIGPVVWRLNDVGKAEISLSLNDDKLTEDNLQFGNRLLIEFDNGLPDWGGVIDPPRRWEYGIVTVAAYSGESIFGYRITDKGRYFSGAQVGTIFKNLIDEANAVYDMQIQVGEVWDGGDGHSPDYHFKDLLTIFKSSLTNRLSDADFYVEAGQDGGMVTFTANIYERRGTDKPGVVLVEGENLTNIRLVEQGSIINSWTMIGEGSGWGADRLYTTSYDADSIADYGLREKSMIYSDVSLLPTLEIHAENALAEHKDPHNMLELTATDEDPAKFADYDVGDRVRVILNTYGFDGYDHMVRIWGREYDAGSGLCKLVVREDD